MDNTSTTDLVDEQLYPEPEAAALLGLSKNTLRNSRNTGQLLGVPAPRFIKMGVSVRYKGSTLREWRDQFPERAPEQLTLPGIA